MLKNLKPRRISIHALHEESDLAAWGAAHRPEISIHALHEESDSRHCGFKAGMVFQSTLSMRRATCKSGDIIHDDKISIHALHEESDLADKLTQFGDWVFQSTLSMRRAT